MLKLKIYKITTMNINNPLHKKLLEQSGFQLDQDGNVEINGQWCNIELYKLIQLTVSYCLHRNRQELFSHNASKKLKEDFELWSVLTAINRLH